MKHIIIAVALSFLALTFLNSTPVQADEELNYCRYTLSLTIRNDKNGGRPLYSFWNGIQFPLGTSLLINDKVVLSGPYTYTGDVVMDIPAGATATTQVTMVASAPPYSIYGPWAVFDLTLPSPYMTSATRVGEPVLTVTDCDGASGNITVKGVQGTVAPTYDWDSNVAGLKVWEIDGSGEGQTSLELSPDFLASLPLSVEANTEFAVSDDGLTRFYVLTTGEYQINFGPDAEGKVSVVVFNRGFQVTNSYEFQLGK
jgi:hypothetical protein